MFRNHFRYQFVLFAVAMLVSGASAPALTVNTLVDEQDGSVTDGDVSLRDAIALAPAGDTINFSVRGTIRLTRGQLNVAKPVIISGPGRTLLTIDASGSDPTPTQKNGDGRRTFSISNNSTATSNKVELRGILIRGGDSGGDGGGVLSQEDLLIDNCEVSGNYTGGSGGGICGTGGKLVISNSSLVGNIALNGGGAVQSLRIACELSNLDVRSNRAGLGGGVCNQLGVMRLLGGVISDNSAIGRGGIGISTGGGGMYNTGGFTIVGTRFLRNQSPKTTVAVGEGGAIYSTAPSFAKSIEGATFESNSADASGGAIYARESFPGGFKISNTQFALNKAVTGGAVYALGELGELADCGFGGNSATNGGALAVSYNASNSPATSVRSCNFLSNRAERDGGAVYLAGGTISFSGSHRYESNFAGGKGGAIYGAASLTGALFWQNSAEFGGGIYSFRDTAVTDCRLYNNTAYISGGGICTSGQSARMTLLRTNVDANTAAQGGGLEIRATDTVTLRSSTARNNILNPTTGRGRDAFNSGTLQIDSTSSAPSYSGPGTVIRN